MNKNETTLKILGLVLANMYNLYDKTEGEDTLEDLVVETVKRFREDLFTFPEAPEPNGFVDIPF